MNRTLLCLSFAGCLFAAGPALAQDRANDDTPYRHNAPQAQTEGSGVSAAELQKQHHAQDRHAKDVEQGRKPHPCASLAGQAREDCLNGKRAEAPRKQ